MSPGRILAGSCLALLALLHPAHSSAQGTKLVLGYANASEFLPAFVAKDREIFAKHGLDVTMSAIASTSLVAPALVSGSVHLGVNTPPNILLAAEGGLDLVAVSGAARILRTNPRIALVTRPGFNVGRAEDLRGKKVGVPGINSSIDLVFRKWLLDNKVSPSQLTFIEAPLPQMADLLKSGQVDAVTPIEPVMSRMVAGGIGVKSVDFFSEVNHDVVGAFWVSTRTWAAANPVAVRAFREAYAEAMAYIAQNPQEARQIEVKWLKFSGPVFPNFSMEIRQSDLDMYQNISRELGVMRQAVDTGRLIWK
jgi:NitT/TauT family transport system substrate-binding protein